MKKVQYHELYCGTPVRYWIGLGVLALLVAIGLGSAYYMEHHGHWVTGMSNQVVWGLPHVFAIFLIVAASGALNVASIGSVFGGPLYKPLGRYSGLLAIALLVGGLMILVLDLGRPDRLIVAMTTYNFKSIFAWNIYLYTGFIVIVGAYLWSMMEYRAKKVTRPDRLSRVFLAHRPDHRYRLHLRVPGGAGRPTTRRLWRRCSSSCRSATAWPSSS